MKPKDLSGNTGRVLFLSHNRDRRKGGGDNEKVQERTPEGKKQQLIKESIKQSILSRKGIKYYEE